MQPVVILYIEIELKIQAMETTRETAQKINHKETVKGLQDLLKINYDSREGFKEVMLKSENPALTNYLKGRAALHSAFSTELSNVLLSLNATPAKKGTASGVIHRTWIDVKTVVTGRYAETLLEECLRGEKAIVDEYKEALTGKNFAPDIEMLLNNQLSYIASTLSEVKTLEDMV
jgi:uncharacterized protein (TIGR02284 family)